jgi:GT2 family glycosyltransferase
MSWGVVVLTQGARPALLAAALESVLGQRDVEAEVVVVGNPWPARGLPAGVRAIDLGANRGIPAGRNAGVPAVGGELLLFLDDDARLGEPTALARLAERFAADDRLGLVQLRVDPDDGGAIAREWVPRLRIGDRTRSSRATVVWEGAVAMRRSAFAAAGGWPEELWAVHEGVDLAWRVLGAGYGVSYAGDIAALHPPHKGPVPHEFTHYMSSRNRVWVARRNLPWPLAVLYVATFALRTAPRLRRRATWRGYRDGVRRPCGPRRPLSWRTLWQMTRAGRPPIL